MAQHHESAGKAGSGGDGAFSVSQPSIVGLGTNSEENRSVYEGWAKNYENDVRKWGYNLPERAADLFREHLCDATTSGHILDAGAGDGLSGVALRKAGLDSTNFTISGVDYSAAMLKIAEERKCYDKVEVVDLQKPLSYETNTFDAIFCIGTLTHLDPKAETLREFVRVTKPGGLVFYSNRTDKLGAFIHEEKRLEDEGKWEEVAKVGPIPYLPNNPDYADKVLVILFIYRVL